MAGSFFTHLQRYNHARQSSDASPGWQLGQLRGRGRQSPLLDEAGRQSLRTSEDDLASLLLTPDVIAGIGVLNIQQQGETRALPGTVDPLPAAVSAIEVGIVQVQGQRQIVTYRQDFAETQIQHSAQQAVVLGKVGVSHRDQKQAVSSQHLADIQERRLAQSMQRSGTQGPERGADGRQQGHRLDIACIIIQASQQFSAWLTGQVLHLHQESPQRLSALADSVQIGEGKVEPCLIG